MTYDDLAHRYLITADALRQIAATDDEPRAQRIARATLKQLKTKRRPHGPGTNATRPAR